MKSYLNQIYFYFLQSGSLDGIWYWDLETPENEWMSPRFWENFGYDPAEKKHLANEWQDMINKDDLKMCLENFEQHKEDPNHPYDQIVRYTKKDGSTAWVRCRGVAIRDKSGKPIRMLGAHNDVTELKETEERLKNMTTKLKDKVRELAQMNKFMIEREKKMIELKETIHELQKGSAA